MEQEVQSQAAPASGNTQAPPPSAGGGSGEVDPQVMALLQNMQKTASSPHQQIAQPRVDPRAMQGSLGKDIGLNALQAFVPFVGEAVQKHVKAEREAQIAGALNVLDGINNELETAEYMSGGDQQKRDDYLNKSPRLQAIFNDKKVRKQLMKVFGTDLMNPEKQNTVYHEAMKRHVELRGHSNMVKKLHGMMQGLAGRDQQQQGGQQQPQQQQGQQGGEPQNPAQMVGNMPQRTVPADASKAEQASLAIKNALEGANAGTPKTDFQAWYKAKTKENDGEAPTSAQIEAHKDAERLKPSDQLVQKALEQAENGDMEGYKATMELVKHVTAATHVEKTPNFIDLIMRANTGDKTAKAGLDKYMALEDEMRESYGRGRARYMYRPFLSNGQVVLRNGLEISAMQAQGQDVGTPVGQLSPQLVIAYQRLQKEAGPKGSSGYSNGAMKVVYDNIKVYDNSTDRAIFAKAMNEAKASQGSLMGDSLETMRTILNGVAVSKLSPEGKNLYIGLKRLNETMGLFRQASGLPATDQSMQLSLALVPGAATPDSKMAKRQTDSLNQMIDNMRTTFFKDADAKPTQKKSLDEALNDAFGKAPEKKK